MGEDGPEPGDRIEAHLQETGRYEPPEAFRERANVSDPEVYERARKDPEAFWAGFAEELDWFEPWDEVLTRDPPFVEWFSGGKINACHNCVDRHVEAGRGDRDAILWEGEPGDRRTLTYEELEAAVCRAAHGLRELGVEAGDRVTMYLPMIPELPVAMLACARIGAVHNVVFGGFSPSALAHRMDDAGSRVLITCDGYYRRGDVVEQKRRADEGVDHVETVDVDDVVTVRRLPDDEDVEVPWTEGRDVGWEELVADRPAELDPVPMDAEDPLFLMYTSGTTGEPKGVVHTTGGYLTGTYATTKWVFDIQDDDVYWCMADIGWITGHSYIVYGPLANGTRVVMYEGAPDHPDPGRPWDVVERYDVSVFYTAPTAIRAFMRSGPDHPASRDLSTLRLLGTVGEPINPAAWRWYHEHVGGEACPIVDTWWQTETGQILITPLPGITTTRPGSASRPFPGVQAEILNDDGDPVPAGEGGYLAITTPWPAMARTIWGDDERYVDTYWSKWDRTTYYPGDAAVRDDDGNFWIVGRVDDVLNVAGHRLGTAEIESSLVGHARVAEAAVVGATHDVKGQVPVAFAVLEARAEPSEALRDELVARVEKDIGPIARPDAIVFADDLPKTRSGKIMRRLLEDIASGRELGDTTTLRNPDVAERLEAAYRARAS